MHPEMQNMCPHRLITEISTPEGVSSISHHEVIDHRRTEFVRSKTDIDRGPTTTSAASESKALALNCGALRGCGRIEWCVRKLNYGAVGWAERREAHRKKRP